MSNAKLFASRLKAIRQKERLTQEEFGARMDVSQQRIAEWEKGGFLPRVDTLVAIAQTFGVSVDYLLGVTDDIARPVDVLTDEEREIVELLRDWLLITNKMRFPCVAQTTLQAKKYRDKRELAQIVLRMMDDGLNYADIARELRFDPARIRQIAIAHGRPSTTRARPVRKAERAG
jgi:transcriptional regulator with XRE-family HTH domain